MDEYQKSFLSEQEVQALIRFNTDPNMFEAVRKLCLGLLYQKGTLRKGAVANTDSNSAFGLILAGEKGLVDHPNDEELGRDLRSLFQAVRMVEISFEAISKFVPEELKGRTKQENKAR